MGETNLHRKVSSEIVKQGSWKNAKKFFNFYKKDIIYYAPEDVDL